MPEHGNHDRQTQRALTQCKNDSWTLSNIITFHYRIYFGFLYLSTGYPAKSLLCTRATAEPATPVAALLSVLQLVCRTSTVWHALAIADHWGWLTLALLGLHMIVGVGHHTVGKCESVCALESVGVTFGTDRHAVQWVRAVWVRGGLIELGRLKISTI